MNDRADSFEVTIATNKFTTPADHKQTLVEMKSRTPFTFVENPNNDSKGILDTSMIKAKIDCPNPPSVGSHVTMKDVHAPGNYFTTSGIHGEGEGGAVVLSPGIKSCYDGGMSPKGVEMGVVSMSASIQASNVLKMYRTNYFRDDIKGLASESSVVSSILSSSLQDERDLFKIPDGDEEYQGDIAEISHFAAVQSPALKDRIEQFVEDNQHKIGDPTVHSYKHDYGTTTALIRIMPSEFDKDGELACEFEEGEAAIAVLNFPEQCAYEAKNKSYNNQGAHVEKWTEPRMMTDIDFLFNSPDGDVPFKLMEKSFSHYYLKEKNMHACFGTANAQSTIALMQHMSVMQGVLKWSCNDRIVSTDKLSASDKEAIARGARRYELPGAEIGRITAEFDVHNALVLNALPVPVDFAVNIASRAARGPDRSARTIAALNTDHYECLSSLNSVETVTKRAEATAETVSSAMGVGYFACGFLLGNTIDSSKGMTKELDAIIEKDEDVIFKDIISGKKPDELYPFVALVSKEFVKDDARFKAVLSADTDTTTAQSGPSNTKKRGRFVAKPKHEASASSETKTSKVEEEPKDAPKGKKSKSK